MASLSPGSPLCRLAWGCRFRALFPGGARPAAPSRVRVVVPCWTLLRFWPLCVRLRLRPPAASRCAAVRFTVLAPQVGSPLAVQCGQRSAQ